MSSFLGVNCLRSSPSLAGVVRAQTQLSNSQSLRTILDLHTGPARRFSIRTDSRVIHQGKPCPIYERITRPRLHSVPAPIIHQRRSLFGRRFPPVLTEYIRLPPDYKDAIGLPFRKGDGLDQEETARIFRGTKITPTLATELLKILHGRRVAGTLDDPSLRKNTATFSEKEITKALEYLRREVPVDEILNAGLRAEDELRELEAESKAKESSSEGDLVSGAGEKESTSIKKGTSDNVYGESVLDRIRAHNVARAEAEEAAEAERLKKEEEAAAQKWGGITPYDPSLHRGLNPVHVKAYEAATSDLEAPPETRRWRLLLPTTAFTAALLTGLYFLVTAVAPPASGSGLETKITIGAIVALNVGVAIAWRRVPLWKFMNRHFLLDLVVPRPHQILTATASHHEVGHLVGNMILLAIGGSLLIPEIGPLPFVATLVASGVCGFLLPMYLYVARLHFVTMLGASASGYGVLCAYFWLYRFDGFKILGLPPDPMSGIQGLGFIGLIMAFFALGPMVRGQGGKVGWFSHLVGMLTGIGCASIMEPRWKAQKKLQGGVEPMHQTGVVGTDLAKEVKKEALQSIEAAHRVEKK